MGGDITLYAKWVGISYTITYDGNTSTSGATTAGSYTTGGTAYTIAANGFAKAGYTFAGWNTLANGTGTAYTAGVSTYSTSAALTLYAQWSVNTFTVTFNGNSNTGGSMATQTASASTALTTNAFTRTGYSFMGWGSSAGATIVSYTDGATYSFAANITLYALWGPNISQIVALNGGTSGAYKMQWTVTGTNFASYFIAIEYGSTSALGTTFTNTISSNPIQTNLGNTAGTGGSYYRISITPYTGASGTGVAGKTRTTRTKQNTATPGTTTDPVAPTTWT